MRLTRRQRHSTRTEKVNRRAEGRMWTEVDALREEMAEHASNLSPGRSVQAGCLLTYATRLGSILAGGQR